MPIEPDPDRIPLRTVADLRGTVAEDASGLSVGRLWGALSESDTGLLRYLDLQLSSTPRHVLVPIGHARLREREGAPTVRLRAALLEDLESIPPFEEDELDDPFEHTLLQAHSRAFHGERYYAHPSFDHSSLYAGEHPIVRDGTVPTGEALQPLSELPQYRVARGEPDIREWELVGAMQDRLGIINDLVVDRSCEKVRYVAVTPAGEDRQVLVPVGYLSVEAREGVVAAPALWHDDLVALPGYSGGPVERTDEETIRAMLLEQLRGRRRYQGPDFSLAGLDGRSDQ